MIINLLCETWILEESRTESEDAGVFPPSARYITDICRRSAVSLVLRDRVVVVL